MLSYIVVDDFPLQGAVLQKMICNTGFELKYLGQALDGGAGLQLALKTKPNILFVDIEMPELDGLSMARVVKEKLPKSRLVILTAHDDFRYTQQAVRLQVDDYLLKPISEKDLIDIFERGKPARKTRTELNGNRDNLIETTAQELVDAIVYGDETTVTDFYNAALSAWEYSDDEQCTIEGIARLALVIEQKLEVICSNPELIQSFYRQFVQAQRVGVSPSVRCDDLLHMLISYSHMFHGESQTTPVYINRAENWIMKNIGNEITLSDLASAVFLSPSHLSRLFKRYKGVCFSEYLLQERLSMACRLLASTDESIEVIASKCGYDKGNSFWKMFKKQKGMSPGQYRQQEKDYFYSE